MKKLIFVLCIISSNCLFAQKKEISESEYPFYDYKKLAKSYQDSLLKVGIDTLIWIQKQDTSITDYFFNKDRNTSYIIWIDNGKGFIKKFDRFYNYKVDGYWDDKFFSYYNHFKDSLIAQNFIAPKVTIQDTTIECIPFRFIDIQLEFTFHTTKFKKTYRDSYFEDCKNPKHIYYNYSIILYGWISMLESSLRWYEDNRFLHIESTSLSKKQFRKLKRVWYVVQ